MAQKSMEKRQIQTLFSGDGNLGTGMGDIGWKIGKSRQQLGKRLSV
jgi:hypothetical protein